MDNPKITLPEILQIPEKLLPMLTKINEYRYFLADGGRGGAKSQSVGRILLYLAEKKYLRIVCGRETQNSINESVYSLLVDLINKYNLCFEVFANKIVHKVTKTVINFRGFREQGAFNIQGMEGIDIVWIDEAQAITKDTLDVLIPTIRKDKAKIFFTMNRYMHNDPVYNTFISRKDCLHIHINYDENPYCTNALITEAKECKLRSEVDYNHIWLGQPLSAGDDRLLNFDDVSNSPNLQLREEGTHRLILSCDVARFGEDETVFTIIKSQNILQWEQIFLETRKGWDLMRTTGYLLDLKRQFRPDALVVDDTGVGGGIVDRLREQRMPPVAFQGGSESSNPLYANKRAESFFMMQDLFIKGYIKILNDAELIEQLLSIRFKYKSNGKKAIVSKDEMRKEGIRSPDRADALSMAVSQIKKIFNTKLLNNINNLPREAEAVCTL